MPVILPDTVYDAGLTYAWQNASDRVSYQRAFEEGDVQARKEAQALIVANPATPNIEISVNMNTIPEPEKWGVKTEPLTIVQVLSADYDNEMSHTDDRTATDFSGAKGMYSGTDVPSLPMW